ncbi:hypothetical protein BKA70DRAFT_1243106 [Coprinopsis sp. MPI-PUGE-AT-0042]|nr:hypothetical protein BKA70DRAFT_1243106 [Coprinopsis sp. MPI-PUGE-AT-0042]
MADIVALSAEELESFLLVAVLRVADSLICFLFHFKEMSNPEKAVYRELIHQELSIALWVHGLFTCQYQVSTPETHSLAVMLSELSMLAARRAWDTRSIRCTLLTVEPDPLLGPDTSPLPSCIYDLLWWRNPEDNEAISTPALVFASYQAWNKRNSCSAVGRQACQLGEIRINGNYEEVYMVFASKLPFLSDHHGLGKPCGLAGLPRHGLGTGYRVGTPSKNRTRGCGLGQKWKEDAATLNSLDLDQIQFIAVVSTGVRKL